MLWALAGVLLSLSLFWLDLIWFPQPFPCFPRLCQWQHLWVSDFAVLPKHPEEPAGPCWCCSVGEALINLLQCLSNPYSHTWPTFQQKGGIKFHSCVLSGKVGNVFQRTKETRDPIWSGETELEYGGFVPMSEVGGSFLLPTSQAWSVIVCKNMALSQAQTRGCAHTAHHQIYGLRQSAPSDNQKASLHESKHKLFTLTQRRRDMQQHCLVNYENLLLELKCNVKCNACL